LARDRQTPDPNLAAGQPHSPNPRGRGEKPLCITQTRNLLTQIKDNPVLQLKRQISGAFAH